MDSSSKKKVRIIPNKSIDVIGEILDNPSVLGKNVLARDYESIHKSANANCKLSGESLSTTNKSTISSHKSFNKSNSIDSKISTKTKRKIEDDNIVKLNIKRSLSESDTKNQEKNLIQSRSNLNNVKNYSQRNLARFNESSYNIMDIIERKRNLLNKNVQINQIRNEKKK